MALKVGLLSFEFETFRDKQYDITKDRTDFESKPQMGLDIQPVIELAFKKIKDCLASNISPNLSMATRHLINLNNFIHIGTIAWSAELHDNSMDSPQTCTLATVKFYRLEPSIRYKVNIDIEDMASSKMDVDERRLLLKIGLSNYRLTNLAQALNKEFKLKDKIELIPIILRGNYEAPRFLSTTDNRLIEYDIENKTLSHTKTGYQEIRVLQSKSLGKMMMLDGRPVLCELDKHQVNSMIDKEFNDYKDKQILILGGGDGTLLNELLTIPGVKFVHLVEIDPRVLETSSIFFPQNKINLNKLDGDKFSISIHDARKFLLEALKKDMKWNMIFNDMTHEPLGQKRLSVKIAPRSQEVKDLEELIQQTSPWSFLEPFFNLSMKCLETGGLFIMKLNNVNNNFDKQTFDKFLADSKFQMKIAIHQSFIPTLMEVAYFYAITKLEDLNDA